MSNSKKILFISALVIMTSLAVNASELDIPSENVFVPQRLASSSSLRFSDQQFNIVLDGKENTIKSYNVRGLPSSLTSEIIENFLDHGYFSVGKSGEDYTLTANLRLRGGGWFRDLIKKITPSEIKINPIDKTIVIKW